MTTQDRKESAPPAVALMRPALHLWWRYTWRMGLVPIAILLLMMFVGGVAIHVASAPGSHALRFWLLLMGLMAGAGLALLHGVTSSVLWIALSPFLALYGIWLFRARIFSDPVRRRGQTLRFEIHHGTNTLAGPLPLRRALVLWMGLFWRMALIGGVTGALLTQVVPPQWLSTRLPLTPLFGGDLSFWWLLRRAYVHIPVILIQLPAGYLAAWWLLAASYGETRITVAQGPEEGVLATSLGATADGTARTRLPSRRARLLRRALSTIAIGAFLVFLPWYLIQYRLLGPGVARGSVWQDDITFFSPWFGWGKYGERVATELTTLNTRGDVAGVAFSPNGHTLAALNPEYVTVWNWRQGRRLFHLKNTSPDTLAAMPLAYSPDGRYIAACHSSPSRIVVRVWNAHTGAVVRNIRDLVNGGGCNAIAFTPNGRSLVRIMDDDGPKDTNFVVYSTKTWQIRWALHTQPFLPSTLALSPHGHWAALGGGTNNSSESGFQEQIALVDLAKHTLTRLIATFSPPPPRLIQGQLVPVANGPSNALAWDPKGQRLAVGETGVDPAGSDAVRIYNVRTGAIVVHESGPVGTEIHALCYAPHGRYLIESGIGHTIEIWDGAHHHLLQEIPGLAESLATSHHGHYLAMGWLGEIQIWHLQ